MQKSDLDSEAKGRGVISYSAYRMKQRQGIETGRVKESTEYINSHYCIIFISLSRDKKLCWGACMEPSETVHYDLFLRAKRCSAIFVDAAGARDVAFEFLEEVGKKRI